MYIYFTQVVLRTSVNVKADKLWRVSCRNGHPFAHQPWYWKKPVFSRIEIEGSELNMVEYDALFSQFEQK